MFLTKKKKNNLIGPISLDDWYYMRMLRESIRDAQEVNPIKYRLLIDTHKKFYRDSLRDIVIS